MVSLNGTQINLKVEYLNRVTMMFIRYYCLILIPVGTMGHLMSLYVFTRRSLRSNPCVMYLRSATIFGLLTSCFILPIRLIQSGYVGIDPTNYSTILCKIIWYLFYSIRLLSYWFVVLACIDRYLCSSSSINKRSWSNIRAAHCVIHLTISIVFIIHIHIPINFNIYINPATERHICSGAGPPGSYRKILSGFNLIVFGLFPPLCMFIFGMLTLHHVRKRKRSDIILSNKFKTSKKKKLERCFLRMLFSQVFVYSVTGLTFSIAIILTTTNSNRKKNLLDAAQEKLLVSIVGILPNTGPCLSFYFFTLSSRRFRKELKKLFKIFTGNFIQLNSNCISTNSFGHQQQ